MLAAMTHPALTCQAYPQYIDVVHREHACVETAGVRTAKAMGLRGLPSVPPRWYRP